MDIAAGTRTNYLDYLRYMHIRFSEKWARYTVFFYDLGISRTYYRIKQAIGRIKAKRVRGYITTAGMLNDLMVSSTKFS
ncbi:MAG: hypothetical protein N2D54_03980 [Chloroflexota bacterium]